MVTLKDKLTSLVTSIINKFNSLNENKQDTLESGVNIKTVGGESLLGSGDVNIVSDVNTDVSLYYDDVLKELRINVGQVTQKFTWNSGPQTFTLVDTPTQIVFIAVNGQILSDPLTQWSIDVENKTITILDQLDVGDVININYKFIITDS